MNVCKRFGRGRQTACYVLLSLLVLLLGHALWTFATGYRGWTEPFPRLRRTAAQIRGLTPSSFRFAPTGPPQWYLQPAPRPLVLRIAIMSMADEFDLRAFLRENVYNPATVPRDEVQFDIKFFLARQPAAFGELWGVPWRVTAFDVNRRVQEEQARYGDIEIIDGEENTWNLCRKRFLAMKWAAQAPQSEYDFFLTADSDSFVRLAALARRMNDRQPDLLNPRHEFSIWGVMMSKWFHWRKSADGVSPDERYDGEWYDFPVGMGYLLSSALTARLHNVSHLLPHNVPYYSDDIAVGSWIFEHAPQTMVINDKGGFHDPPMHGSQGHPIDYGTVLIHHVDLNEMRQLRSIPEWESEWQARSPRQNHTV
ncbi:hypothetical protein EXIGLDRAFT_847156, partial [Exidia glandulosa HHB12029]